MAAAAGSCHVCRESIVGSHVSTQSHKYHKECFVCHQCLEPFKENVFFEADGGYYCESDFSILFGARCAKCGDVISGKCVSALDAKWHIEHFNCENCGRSLVGSSFIRKDDKPYCKHCPAGAAKRPIENTTQGASQIQQPFQPSQGPAEICGNCGKLIEPQTGITYRGKRVHAAHISCRICREPLTSTAREYEGELYCITDFDRILTKTCYACRRPILGIPVSAIGKIYHPEHFVCVKCDKPFGGEPYFEYLGNPYCEPHFKEITGSICLYCRSPAKGNVVSALGARWCENHFMCTCCFAALVDGKVKFMEWDGRPVCRRCFDKLPGDVRRNIARYREAEKKYMPDV